MSLKNPVRTRRQAAVGANKSWQSLMKNKCENRGNNTPRAEGPDVNKTHSKELIKSAGKTNVDGVKNQKITDSIKKCGVQKKTRQQSKNPEGSFQKVRKGRKNLKDQLMDNSKNFNENVTCISDSYFCKNCDFVTTQILLIKSHLRTCQDKKKSKKRSTVQTCHQCDIDFPSIGTLKEHFIEKHQQKRYRCTKCETEYETRNDFTKHIRKVHSKINKSSATGDEAINEKQNRFKKHWKKSACSNFENSESHPDSVVSQPVQQNEISNPGDQPILFHDPDEQIILSGDRQSETSVSPVLGEQLNLSDDEMSLLKTQFLQHSQLLLTQFMIDKGNDADCKTMIKEIEGVPDVLNISPIAREVKNGMDQWEEISKTHSNDKMLAENFAHQNKAILFPELVPKFSAMSGKCNKNNKGIWLKSEDQLLKMAFQKLSDEEKKQSKMEQAKLISSSLSGKNIYQIWNRLRNMDRSRCKRPESTQNDKEEAKEVDLNENIMIEKEMEKTDSIQSSPKGNDLESSSKGNDVEEMHLNVNDPPMDISMHLHSSDPYFKKDLPVEEKNQSTPMLRWSQCSLDEDCNESDFTSSQIHKPYETTQQPGKGDGSSSASMDIQAILKEHCGPQEGLIQPLVAKELPEVNKFKKITSSEENNCEGDYNYVGQLEEKDVNKNIIESKLIFDGIDNSSPFLLSKLEIKSTYETENSKSKLSQSNDLTSLSFLRETVTILNNVDICEICTLEVSDKTVSACCSKVCCRFCLEVMTDVYADICPLCNKSGNRNKLAYNADEGKLNAPSKNIAHPLVTSKNSIAVVKPKTVSSTSFRPWEATPNYSNDVSKLRVASSINFQNGDKKCAVPVPSMTDAGKPIAEPSDRFQKKVVSCSGFQDVSKSCVASPNGLHDGSKPCVAPPSGLQDVSKGVPTNVPKDVSKPCVLTPNVRRDGSRLCVAPPNGLQDVCKPCVAPLNTLQDVSKPCVAPSNGSQGVSKPCVAPSNDLQNVSKPRVAATSGLLNVSKPCVAPSNGLQGVTKNVAKASFAPSFKHQDVLSCKTPGDTKKITPFISSNSFKTWDARYSNFSDGASTTLPKNPVDYQTSSDQSFGADYSSRFGSSDTLGQPWYQANGPGEHLDFEARGEETCQYNLNRMFNTMEGFSGGSGYFNPILSQSSQNKHTQHVYGYDQRPLRGEQDQHWRGYEAARAQCDGRNDDEDKKNSESSEEYVEGNRDEKNYQCSLLNWFNDVIVF